MTEREVILNEIQKVRGDLSGNSNLLIKGDSDFDSFVSSFPFGNALDDIYLAMFRRLDDIHFRILLLFDNQVIMNDYQLTKADGLDKALNYGKKFLDTFLTGYLDGEVDLESYDDIDPVIVDLTDIYDASYSRSTGEIEISFGDDERPVYLNMELIREKGNKHMLFSTLADLMVNIAYALNEKERQFDEVLGQLVDLAERDDYNKLIQFTEDLLRRSFDDDEKYYFYFFRSAALIEVGNMMEAQKSTQMAFSVFHKLHGDMLQSDKWSIDQRSLYSDLKHLSARVSFGLKGYEEAFWEVNDACNLTSDDEARAAYREYRDRVMDELMAGIDEIDFEKRKLIYIERDMPSFKPETILPLRIDKLGQLTFPASHPRDGQLYIAHPHKTKCYYPAEEYEQLLFDSMFSELNYLLQCLGATEIRGEHIKGTLMPTGAKVTSSNNEMGGDEHKGELPIKRFWPKKAPYVPNDLVWYQHNDAWQKLAQRRLHEGVDNVEIMVSSKNVVVINEREKSKINSDYKLLVSSGYQNSIYHSAALADNEGHTTAMSRIISGLFRGEGSEWKLMVSFVPVAEMTSVPASTVDRETTAKVNEVTNFNENELKYIEDVKFFIQDDGKIDDDERRMLERNQSRYNISDVRAKELEDALLNKNHFSTDELEFIDELNFILDHDGEIDDGDRRILIRLASKLGINEQRATEIEAQVLKSREADGEFTEKEQQYIEELNFCLEEGPEITRSGRRLLDRERDSLGISEERAAEIEEVIIGRLKKVED